MNGHSEGPLTLTYSQAAAYAGLSERHIRRLVQAGHLKTMRVDGAVRIPAVEIEEFVARASGRLVETKARTGRLESTAPRRPVLTSKAAE